MARLNQKQTLFTLIGVTVLLCGGSGGGVYWAKGLIKEERDKIAAKDQQIAAATDKIEKIPGIEKSVIILRENVAKYVEILPKEAELTDFTRAAQKFAQKSGIEIISFVPVRGGSKGGAFQRINYQYEFESTLWQFMQFINFFETYERFVSIRDYNLTSSPPAIVGEDAIHKFRVVLETYVYTLQSSGRQTKISNYDTKKNNLKGEIAAEASLSTEEPYRFVGREGRRDIFIDPRQRGGSENAENAATSLVEQRRLIEELGRRVSELKGKWDRSTAPEITMFERIELISSISEELAEVKAMITEVSEQKLIKNPALNSRWYKEVQAPYKDLAAEMQETSDEVDSKYLTEEEFVKLIRSISDELSEGGLEAAVAKYNTVFSKIDVPSDDPRFELRLKVESLIVKAKVALEFSAIPLVVGGVVVNSEGLSGVHLNGESYLEGEYVNAELYVQAVREEEIEFVYKGFTLVKTF